MSAYTTIEITREKAIQELLRVYSERMSAIVRMEDYELEDELDEVLSDTDGYVLNNFTIKYEKPRL